ncbi:helix-turn-helix domain-containing protein [Amycolatopsis sp. H20-H5]|uniref:helix-turn-helix domain-containing protein n=1 Tax=Amycolatopsis sp. H20-H5 TaxID=3046309 RepID=UPI002DBE466E|nr:helix-turn-helix domain-containing protein [Amycolatopsis sp. H20-H5]MEC3982201.1 helix-turn-helix domain-containing protein [Amycolatopsis sp. H20-H5]
MPSRRIPAGIVNEQLANRMFTLSRHAPAPGLAPFVDHYWVLRWDLTGKPPHEQRVLPNLAVNVTFFQRASGVFGPAHEVFSHVLDGAGQGVGARFRPGCFRPFLGRAVSTITDRSIPLEEIFGSVAGTITESVQKAADDGEIVRQMDSLLSTNARRLPPAAGRAAEVVESIADEPAITKVSDLVTLSGLGARSLQRLFAEHVGTTPKWAIRVCRINDAARRITTDPAPDYAALAADLGYSDQAHFSRDLRTMTGVPPSEYTRLNRSDA